MTIYKPGTRKYNTANRIYKKKRKLNKVQRARAKATKWIYGKLGLLG